MPGKFLITDIARGSAVDGPGVRTVIFFKGCPLRCSWCHNPESHSFLQELAYYPDRCIRCGVCQQFCPVQALDMGRPHIVNRDICIGCGDCPDVCDSLALQQIGKYYTAEELLEIILQDRAYYDASGGGVTLTGGEPLLHMEYLEPLLAKLKRHGIHIAMETCGYFHYQEYKSKCMPYIDLLFYDIKLIDPFEHKEYTGKSNELILDNLFRLVKDKANLIPRFPLVQGITATPRNIRAVAELLKKLDIPDCKLLSYNPSAIKKWEQLGKKTPAGLPEEPMRLAEEETVKILIEQGRQAS